MNAIMNGWFSEINDMWEGVCLSLQVEKILHSEKSKYQEIMVLQTVSHGRALILDGIIQCTEFDEFSYQEMISYLPLCSHPNPKKVLIVGGGDGGVAREVVKHDSIETVDMVEIDDRVVEVCKQFMKTMACGFDSPKLNLFIEDGINFIRKRKNEYDVIITDSSDPVGPAVCLFQREYFELLKASLKPGGIICSQAGSVWCSPDIASESFKLCKDVFDQAAFACVNVPTYPSGQIGLVLGSTNPQTDFTKPEYVFTDKQLEDKKFRYYNQEIHSASFVLPSVIKKLFSS